MKTKNLSTYLETRLSQAEINEIERAAQLEQKAFTESQKEISDSCSDLSSDRKKGARDQ